MGHLQGSQALSQGAGDAAGLELLVFHPPEGRADDDVGGDKHRPLQPVRLRVAEAERCHQEGREQQTDLEHLEVQVEGLAEGPAEEDHNGHDEHGDLRGRADGDPHREVELAFTCEVKRRDLLREVADHRQDHRRHKGLVDVQLMRYRLDGLDEEVAMEGDQDCGKQEEAACEPTGKLRLVLVALILVVTLAGHVPGTGVHCGGVAMEVAGVPVIVGSYLVHLLLVWVRLEQRRVRAHVEDQPLDVHRPQQQGHEAGHRQAIIRQTPLVSYR
mmetsp:Transcript_17888/g.51493  ORF Transcript_17888/g.51493 Transcript_17888/m.51493 type:complete len:272 (-) Transcript_17888:538-1353(-)